MPQLYMIVPVNFDGRPDNTLPGGPPDHISNRPPGSWGGPVDPGYGRPGWSPVDPGWGGGPPTHPGNRPPGSWDGSRPDNTLPDVMPQGGTEVPPDVYARLRQFPRRSSHNML